MSHVSRRSFLSALSVSVAGTWLAADGDLLLEAGRRAARAARRTPPAPFRVLTPEQAADLDALTAQVIPTDDTPGAREAHAVYFIDQALATFAAGDRPKFAKGHAAFRARVSKLHGATPFAKLTSAQQIALMTSLEKEKDDFFEMIRGATIAGMLANPEHGGNYQKLGWKMIGFQDRFAWSAPFGWYDRDAR